MKRLIVVLIGIACGGLSLPAGEFYTSSGIVPIKGMSDDGKSLILRTAPGAAEKSYYWRPPDALVEIPDLPGGATRVRALAISGNGETVVGWSSSSLMDSEAIRWTSSSGTVALGDLATGRYQSEAIDCNNAGDFIIGTGTVWHNSMQTTQAAAWTADDNIHGMGFLPGGTDWTNPIDCSENGSIVVGSGFTVNGAETFIWNSIDGLNSLGLIPNEMGEPTWENAPLACSDTGDHLAVFGYSDFWGYTHGPISIWLWSEDSGFQKIAEAPGEPDINGPPKFSSNTLVSDDMGTIVAQYSSHSGAGIFRWREGMGIDELEWSGKSLSTFDISADGQVVVGTMMGYDNVSQAVLWGPDGKIKILKDFLDETGTDTGETELVSAYAVSADGKTIAGSLPYIVGNPPGAFYATISGLWIFDEVINEIWRESPWYGVYATTDSDFIWHDEHGFQLPYAETAGALFVYDVGLDCWYWTSQEVYPFFYKYGYMEGWMYYYLGSTPTQRWFFALSEGETISEDELRKPAP